MGNHLWQSTVFAGAVWLLTLLLRKNSAQSRYVLWLVASAKFLIPFSLLIALGSHIAWTKAPATPPSLFVMTQAPSEPFDTGNLAPVAHASDTPLAAFLRALPNSSVDRVVLWMRGRASLLLEPSAPLECRDASSLTSTNGT